MRPRPQADTGCDRQITVRRLPSSRRGLGGQRPRKATPAEIRVIPRSRSKARKPSARERWAWGHPSDPSTARLQVDADQNDKSSSPGRAKRRNTEAEGETRPEVENGTRASEEERCQATMAGSIERGRRGEAKECKMKQTGRPRSRSRGEQYAGGRHEAARTTSETGERGARFERGIAGKGGALQDADSEGRAF
jgi:hypothetical protein